MVLYRTNNYGYGRFFIPVEYAELRPIFWNMDSQNYSSEMSVDTVSKFCKINNGLHVTNPTEIADLIFSSFRDIKSRKRFCVIPLIDGRKESIQAFRKIYQLAFELQNTASITLPSAIAALVEMGRSRDQERLDANLIQLANEHTELMKKRDWLQRLSNTETLFNNVKNLYIESKREQLSYSTLFKAIQEACTSVKQRHASNFLQLDSEYQNVSDQLEEINIKIEKLTSSCNRTNGALELLEINQKRKSDELSKSLNLRSSYGDKTPLEILEILNEELSEQNGRLEKYKEEGGIQELLAENIRTKNALITKSSHLENFITNAQSTLLHQLGNVASINTLYSLNKDFSTIAVDLDNRSKQIINEFSTLFGKDGAGHLSFLDVSFSDTPYTSFDLDTQLLKWEEELNKLNKRIREIGKNIDEQKNAIQHDNIKELLLKTEKEIVNIEKDIDAITGIGNLQKDLEGIATDIQEKKIQFQNDSNELNSLKNRGSEIKGKLNELNRKKNELDEQRSILDIIDASLKNSKSHNNIIDVDYEPYDVNKLSKEVAQKLLERSSIFENSFANFKTAMLQLQTDLPHPDIDNHQYFNDLHSYSSVIGAYENSFATLEYDRLQHTHAIRTHNQLVNNQLNELKESKKLLINYIAEINRDLNSKLISNLSHIELTLELSSNFLSLLETLEKHDIQDESLLEPRFYETLAVFVNNHFNRKTRRLKLRDIISSIRYSYTLSETGNQVTKDQSGGTTSTITAFVLAVLLKRITPTYVRLQIPIVVDEISTIDYINADSTIQQVANHGFSIFCATPNFSAFIAQKVGRWAMVDRAMVKHPMVSMCHMNILPQHYEAFGEHSNETE